MIRPNAPVASVIAVAVVPALWFANTTTSQVPVEWAARLDNATYTSAFSDTVQLSDGESFDPETNTTVWRGDAAALADLDGDGDDDAVTVTITSGGGSGAFVQLHLMENEDPEFAEAKTFDLGDRSEVHSIQIDGRDAAVTLTPWMGPDAGETVTRTFDVGLEPSGPNAPGATWLVVGDSYAAGQGAADAAGVCGRSGKAWGPLAARIMTSEYGWYPPKVVHDACTGAVISNLYHDAHAVGDLDGSLWRWAQTDLGAPPDGRFDLVVTTFGGNDLGFSEVLYDCIRLKFKGESGRSIAAGWIELLGPGGAVADDCDVDGAELLERADALADPDRFVIDDGGPGGFGSRVTGSLADFYRTVAQRHLKPYGHLFVLGYPKLFATSREWGLWQGGRCHSVTRGDANMIRKVVARADEVMAAEVAQANRDMGDDRIHFVAMSALFDGNGKSHNLCGGGSDWINGITPAKGWKNSFHPTIQGYRNQAELLSVCLGGERTLRAGPSRCKDRLPH